MKKKLLAIGIFFLIIGFASVVNKTFASTAEGTLGTGLQTGLEGVTKAAPTVSPAVGTYHATQTVTLTAAGATKICYTTDGTTAPVCSGATTCSAGTALISGGTVSVAVTTTIKSAGCYADASTGPIATSLYTLNCTTVANTATYHSYPTCGPATCNSGYSVSGGACVASGGGSPSGGGSGGSTTYCSNVTYGAWSVCVSNRQTRTVVSQTPSGCTLTSAQQIAVGQTCTIAKPVTTPIDNSSASWGTFRLRTQPVEPTNPVAPVIAPTPVKPVGVKKAFVFTKTIKYKSENNEVLELQKRLQAEKLLTAKPNGYFGKATEQALKNYQKKNKIKVTGINDAATRKVLNKTTAPVTVITAPVVKTQYFFTKTLKYGNENNEVLQLQLRLQAEKLLTAKPNGYFGKGTLQAVKDYQKLNNLKVTGNLDAATREALNK